MDTSTGQIYGSEKEIQEAFKKGEIKDMANLVELPPEIATQLIGMNRQGRRLWWKQNRKKMNLPRWSERKTTAITNHTEELLELEKRV